ncbi:MAG: hypothetical protein ACKVP0_11425 [Pirellulaceae bacterium]
MFRPFRPTLETLETREVFSAGPLAVMPPAIPEGGSGQSPVGVFAAAARSEFASMTRPFADGLILTATSTGTGSAGSATGTYEFSSRGPNVPATGIRVASADLNGDGMVGVAAISNNSWGGGSHVDYRHPDLHPAYVDDVIGWDSVLPYIEQDNLYKFSSAHDRLFAELGSGNDFGSRPDLHSQILLGLLLP